MRVHTAECHNSLYRVGLPFNSFPRGKKKEGTNSRFLNDPLLYDSTASLLFFNNAKMHFKLDVFKGLIFVFR